ncbi:xanthine dehydrogenase family protein molybdopterin-binding subunit [Amycolatopsis acidiphila]|uniref:Xanthine dehydrogenase family protein molybdopterin-binding subunit n=1 Tax=Amycolatopsis acidiphila TaxID=715473 RepID=A0A557ZUQ8_9PSEU|nr:xanthine dehydrogenase family protein molybdopterin-binding subunit [Amycolatopsis acidiphila]TVT15763.1 xanthine dehydrogenase family protein molybdopterin-binding subunit [Amycolatopsis acidiphila]UIJ56847.1 xanthine dehydrogenase family protein molybdopterin-binding subunit [Amycolatopsis acidiphila]GHG54793.1 carbon-monoxide dehydrogenase large subunit [Amycolatopsis acidiphila]
MSIVGTRVVRIEDQKLITKGGTYVEDVREEALTGAVHAMFVRSPIAHARITSIDTAEALAAPGVVAVYTAADLDLGPRQAGPVVEPWLASDVVRYVGEPVALVLTEHRYQLADAAELIDIDYDPLDAVASIDAALSDETLVFPDMGSNVVQVNGMPEFPADTFDGCEVVVTQTIVNQRVAPAPLEVRGAACAWGEDDRLTVWLSTQNAQIGRTLLAAGLGVGEEKVRVITPDVGGGFGAKIGSDPEPVVLGWAAQRAGRPIRWTETRSENLTSMTHGRAQQNTVTVGGRRDGTVEVFRLDVVQDAGAYPRTLFLPTLTELMASGVYHFPKIETRSRGVVTTTTPIAAYRGAGRPEATAAIERAMDLFATEIGMDPAEVRKANFIRPEEFPYKTKSGANYDTGEYAQALDKVLDAAGYAGLRAEQRRRREAGEPVVLGLGIASYVEITGGDSGGESGRVDINPDGTVTAYTGSSPHGQGLDTSLTMLLSDQLGIPMERISIRHGDTDEVPKAIGTFGSRSLQLGGSAVRQAADKVIANAREIAADMLEAAPEDLELNVDEGAWQVRGAPASGSVDWVQLAARAEQGVLSADVWFGEGSPTFPFGAHLAVVDVDTETGKVVVRRVIAADDAGPVINPLAFRGQRHGGLGQGVAQALLEVMAYDPDGNPTTATLADYSFITATELPDFELVDSATPTTRNLLGVKGIGEAATIGSTPAVHNAVVDALAHLGVRHLDMPTTPQRVWEALSAKGEAK